MLRFIFLFAITVFFINMAAAQKSFDITIRLDSSINPQKIKYQYYNGKSIIFLPDTFGNQRVVRFKQEYYSPLASFTIYYTDSNQNPYNNDFFISNKPAVISFYFKPNNENKLYYSAIVNASPIFDTVANKILGKLNAFMTGTAMTKENAAFDLFLKQNPNFNKNDSLKRVFNKFYKSHLNRAMLFLKKYPDDYFSFWYFIRQVAQVNQVLGKDTAYLKEQLAYLKSVFPAKYTESVEGKALIETYEAIIYPLRLNKTAPLFTVTAIDGERINLSEFSGKYVLLDFWATWCPPCMAEIPFIKEVRKNNPTDKLVIIGISQDVNLKQLTATVKNKAMNWLQFYDKDTKISHLYGLNEYPTLILLNKDGKVIYKSDHKTADSEALPKLLNAIN